jgi:hypothetical protein
MTIKINGTNTTAQPSITGADTDTGLVYGTDEVQVVTGGTTRATVDSAGNLGVGTSSPSGLIHTVQASGASRIRFEASNSHSFTRLIAGSTSYNASVELFSGSTNTANITGLGAGGLQFEVGGSERLRILSSGGLTFNGDTAAANALDDYEEGTFTFTVTQGVTSPTYNTTGGTYTKIGNCVTFTARMQVASGTVNGAQVRMGGLPFTTNSTLNAGGASFSYYGNINGSGEVPQAFIPKNDTIIILYGQDGGTWNGNSGNGLVNSILHIHGHYYV